MEVIYHYRVQNDISHALTYYENEGGVKLGDCFFEEVENTVSRVIKNPQGFHFEVSTFRRASLHSFPYHLIYEVDEFRIKFLVLRNDKRHPSFGMRRK